MAHVCPWWIGYLLASPLRRLWHNPPRILGPLVRDGDLAVEIGPGMGFFTLDLARLVGERGRVVAVDVQPRMLAKLEDRARKAGLADRIDARLAAPGDFGTSDLHGRAALVLAFAVVHELPDVAAFFAEAARLLAPRGRGLFAEPTGHVTVPRFEASLALAAEAGLRVVERPAIRSCHAAILGRAD
ncbi:MAG: methyltransferase domain-containing protein [Deltaproteobacteria bacterium]|nr:methyltransferase domain-containing protein [Deltaproteobacteria bacterium]